MDLAQSNEKQANKIRMNIVSWNRRDLFLIALSTKRDEETTLEMKKYRKLRFTGDEEKTFEDVPCILRFQS